MFSGLHSESPSAKRAAITVVLIAVALFVLAVCRAILIPFTHDEALSFSMFSVKSLNAIFSYEGAGGMPNNHILNTLWLKLAAALFGDSTLSLRGGNLIALAIYLYAAVRLSFVLTSPLLRVISFLLLCMNPFVFDFFALARGYGMSNGLLLFAMWQLYQWWERPSVRGAFFVMLPGALMVLANFSALHVYFALIAILVFVPVFRREITSPLDFFRVIGPPVLITILLGAALYQPFVAIMNEHGAFGGETGFWNDCAIWLMSFTTYGKPYAFTVMEILPWLIMLVLFAMCVSALLQLIRRERNFFFITLLCVFIPVFTMQLQHWFLGTEFPVARTVQYMHPLFMLSVVFFVNHVLRAPRVAIALSGFFALLLSTHFVNSVQCRYVPQWQYDAGNRQVLTDIGALRASDQPVKLSITWIFEPGLNYERNHQNLTWLQPLNRDGIENESDYYYVTSEDSATLAARGKKVLRFYPESGTSLMK